MTALIGEPSIWTQLNDLDPHQFGTLIEPYRRQIQAHCYRMMGTLQDAEDMAQETFLRAWQGRHTYAGRASLRAWVYGIATHVCLDALKKRPRRAIPVTYRTASSLADPIPTEIRDPIWLEPYPDDLLDPTALDPESQLAERENMTLAFIAALHLLPPRQRAILILRDALDCQANEVADLLEMSVPAVKSALHRARSTLASRKSDQQTPFQAMDAATRSQLDQYVRAWQSADVEAFLALLKADAAFSMPPIPTWYQGHAAIQGLVLKTVFGGQASGRWRLLLTHANRQPAFGLYQQTENGYRAYGIQVITFRDGLIADMTTFINPALFAAFKLPLDLTAA